MFQGIVKLYRWPLLVLVAIFSIGVVVGLVLPISIKLALIQATAEKFSTIINNSPTTWQLSFNIFTNNVTAGLIVGLLGFTVFLADIVIFGNGVIVGVFLSLLYRTDALLPGTFWGAVLSLLPHGIFELPAFFLAGAITITITLKAIFHKHIEVTKTRSRVLYEGIVRFMVIVVPLFAMAALLESFVSPHVGTAATAWLAERASDPKMAVTLNTTGLAQAGCIPLTDTETNTKATSTIEAKALFDETFYNRLSARKRLPFWKITLSCRDHGMISVRAWPADRWSSADAIDLTKQFYDIDQIPYNQADSQLISTSTAGTITQTWLTMEDKTVEVAQYNYSSAIKNILSLTTTE